MHPTKASQWHNNKLTPLYLFAPGIFACESQAANYCKEMIASTGEAIHNSNQFELFPQQSVIACNFAECTPTGTETHRNYNRSQLERLRSKAVGLAHKAVNIFAPYFINNYYINRGLTIIKNKLSSSTINPFQLKPLSLSLGQERDVETLTECYQQATELNPDKPIVLYGFSRGAAATFNFIATKYPQQNIKNVKAIILEACFDSISNCMSVSASKLLDYLLPDYTHRGLEPIRSDILEAFITTCNARSIPVLFITSTVDNRVPSSCVNNLLVNLLTNNLNSCYLTTLSHSRHSQYMRDNDEDTALLLKAVHCFYQQFDLPYIPDLATAHITKKSFYEIK